MSDNNIDEQNGKKNFSRSEILVLQLDGGGKNPPFQVVVIEVYEESFGRTKNTSFSSDISV